MFTFTIRPDGGDEYTATATSRDIVAWEKAGKGRSLGRIADSPAMADLYALAWQASRRLGHFTGPFAEFETGVDLDFTAADEAADPTRTAR